MRRSGWGVVLAASLCGASEAWAKRVITPVPGQIYLGAGLLLNASARSEGFSGGVGGELSLHGWLDHNPLLGLGVFGQWQSINSEHYRVCAGAQATLLWMGVELGVAREYGGTSLATTSVHVSPFISVGLVGVGLRIGVPLVPPPFTQNAHGFEMGLTLTVKLPIPLRGAIEESPGRYEDEEEEGEPPPPPPSNPPATKPAAPPTAPEPQPPAGGEPPAPPSQ